MGSEKKVVLSSDGDVKLIEWEDFEQELARLWSLSSALKKSKEKKDSLQQKLESLIQQVRAESLNRLNELELMKQKLEGKKLVMGSLVTTSNVVAEDVRCQKEQLTVSIRSLLVAGKALSLSSKQLQEANRLLAGERGHVRLKNLQKMLQMRLQYMVAQVSALYPVKASVGLINGEKLDSSSTSSKLGNPAGSKPGALTISGLAVTSLPLKKMSFFSDKKEVQKSATALGYVAHAVSLIASYLEIPLRYPLHLGGSRSYIHDYAPSFDVASSASASNSILLTNSKPTEFPLFLEGQDTTRAAYAIFLLNKDLEQLLNSIGVQSLGPRHVLANLKELLKTIQSQDYVR
ncbi:UV radiation resistance protein/autophagy-related protein 14 [Macleaya cordata]|uniref:UV radiation resistance protein/autophagy-related protein 14 n=1 Tax=Macleaya cordata TaxID=56857 RepID=A0A200QTP6_MACCD|nr:UV radiation resistance protein/autophagy-related protein 14 [Macleaya cordata]